MAENGNESFAAKKTMQPAEWAALGLIAVLTIVHVLYYFPRVVDDLFISLRYAKNLTSGNGAVYNLGERVEGYSSPAWMMLQALGMKLGIEGVTWTKAMGVTCLLGLEYALYALARNVLRVRWWLACVAPLVCACNSYVVNWALLGLETPLHLASIAMCAVAVDRHARLQTRASMAVAIGSVFMLGTTRPESPLYIALIAVGTALDARQRNELGHELRRLWRRALAVFVPAGLMLTTCLGLRFAYYGHIVPNTYFVKGANVSFGLDRLEPLFRQGASPMEAAAWLGGFALLAYFGWRRRAITPALLVLGNLYFAGSVLLDWMPSLRHLLPTTVVAPLGWLIFADEMITSSPRFGRIAAAVSMTLLGGYGVWLVQIDNRYSVEERRGRDWILPKTTSSWHDTRLAFQRVEPPHVTRMDTYEMGQISQSWAVLETSDESIDDTWFAGRDIGAVGYYTGAKVFDTAGLFTPAVSYSEAWTQRRQITDEMIDAMMRLRPVAGEIYEGWEAALARRPALLANYRIRVGSPAAPIGWIATDRRAPSPAQIVGRYSVMVNSFPKLFHLHTLYGESVGAVVERRLRIVKAKLGAQ